MGALEGKTFDSPDEVREFKANGKVELVSFAGGPIGRGTFDPLGAHDLVDRRNAELAGLPDLIARALDDGFRFGRRGLCRFGDDAQEIEGAAASLPFRVQVGEIVD